jgi:hypothetical protein
MILIQVCFLIQNPGGRNNAANSPNERHQAMSHRILILRIAR